jgi:hypothetical protein
VEQLDESVRVPSVRWVGVGMKGKRSGCGRGARLYPPIAIAGV